MNAEAHNIRNVGQNVNIAVTVLTPPEEKFCCFGGQPWSRGWQVFNVFAQGLLNRVEACLSPLT